MAPFAGGRGRSGAPRRRPGSSPNDQHTHPVPTRPRRTPPMAVTRPSGRAHSPWRPSGSSTATSAPRPLYAFRETLAHGGGPGGRPRQRAGRASLVLWALIIVITVKYLVFVMRADNKGEGGILALDLAAAADGATADRAGAALVACSGLFGTALLYGDGMITPAISVLAAVEGLEVVTRPRRPSLIPIAIGHPHRPVQRADAAAPATIGRRLRPGHAGLVRRARRARASSHIVDAGGARALNPLLRHRVLPAPTACTASSALGSVFLVVTGGEALYADMGHFGRTADPARLVRVVLPALLLNYFGQGALLLRDPEADREPLLPAGARRGRCAAGRPGHAWPRSSPRRP